MDEASLVGLVARKTQTVLHKVHCSAYNIFIHHNLFIMYYILHYNVVLLKALLAKDRPDFIIFALTMRIKIRAEAFSLKTLKVGICLQKPCQIWLRNVWGDFFGKFWKSFCLIFSLVTLLPEHDKHCEICHLLMCPFSAMLGK